MDIAPVSASILPWSFGVLLPTLSEMSIFIIVDLGNEAWDDAG